MSFPITDAAFEGFRLARERPRTMLIWAAAYFCFNLLLGAALAEVLGPDATLFTNPPQNLTQAQAMALLPVLGKTLAVATPLVLVMGAILTGAVYRILFRPDERAFGYLRLGLDEARIIGVWLVMLAAVTAATFVPTLAALSIPGGSELAQTFAALFGFCASIWLAVRLSLAAPMAFTDGRIHLASAWRRTEGQFWTLFGCYFLAFVFAAIVWILGMIIATAARMILAQALGAQGPGGILSAVVYVTVLSVMAALLNAIGQSPPAMVHRDLPVVDEAI